MGRAAADSRNSRLASETQNREVKIFIQAPFQDSVEVAETDAEISTGP